MKLKTALIATSLFLGLLSSPLYSYTASIKAMGMGMVGTAYAQDAEAAAFNPAGMSEIGDRYDVGLLALYNEGWTRVSGNFAGANGGYRANDLRFTFNPHFGINKQINDCWTLGLTVYNRENAYTKYTKPIPILGTSNLRLSFLEEVIAPTVTYKINRCHSVGLSLDIAVQSLDVSGVENFAKSFYSRHPDHCTNKGRDTSWGVGVTMGWLGQVTDRLKLGLAYQPEIRMRRFSKYKGFIAEDGRLHLPQLINFGLSYELTCRSHVAFDINHTRWSHIRGLANPMQPNLDLLLPRTNPAYRLGTSDAPGYGFKNELVFRLGVDYKLTDCFTLRAGVRDGNCLIRKKNAPINALINEVVTQYVTVGGTYTYCDGAELSWFYAHGFKNDVFGRNTIPTSLGSGSVKMNRSKDVVGISFGNYF